MCAHKKPAAEVGRYKTLLFLFPVILALMLAVFGGCDAMDSFLTSAQTYKINAKVNGISIDECSFFSINDRITPFFEDPVANDPDITSLVISIKNLNGETFDNIAVYSLENETEDYDAYINVKNLDDDLPFFILPKDLPKGFYTMIFEVKSGRDVLQRVEKEFYYLSNTYFSYKGIDVHLPGVSDNPYLVSKGQVIMLESKLVFDNSLDPYIVWYNGRSRISEGAYSEGADKLFWKAPEMSNFYPLRAEIFPEKDFRRLAGYLNEVSVLVSSISEKNALNIHMIKEDIPELVNWYTFEGNLNDSKTPVPVEYRSIKPAEDNVAAWLPSGGTYGLATGYENIFTLPKTSFTAVNDTWQLLFRFKALDYGNVLTVNFGTYNVTLSLNVYTGFVELSLASGLRKSSRIYGFKIDADSFTTMGIKFFIERNTTDARNLIGASINIFGETIEQGETALEPVYLDLGNNTLNDFQVILGQSFKEEIFSRSESAGTLIINIDDEQDEPEQIENIDIDDNKDYNISVFDELAILPSADLNEIEPSDQIEDSQTADLGISSEEENFFNAADYNAIDYNSIDNNAIVYNALWDEFALYNNPSMDIIAKDIIKAPADSAIESAYE